MALALALAVVATLDPSSPGAAAAGEPDGTDEVVAALAAELDAEVSGPLRIAVEAETEAVTFVAAPAGAALAPAAVSPEIAATGFVDEYGPMFGSEADQLVVDRLGGGVEGTSVVRFRQEVAGVPVLAGEVAVQIDAAGRVVSASGETSADLASVDTVATVGADVASTMATQLTAKVDEVDPALLEASAPALWIYDPQLIGAADVPSPRLVWRVDVRTELGDVDRLVLIDAHDAAITLHVSTVAHAAVAVCNNANNATFDQTCTPARVARSTELPAPTGNADVDGAYDAAVATNAFYAEVLGRDGIDGAGMRSVATVNHCPQGESCPYDNAYWNGAQVVFGAGYATADDVVAHELSHGLTEYTSGLFYYAESGAINEAMSDIFGELIDQTNVGPRDTPDDRWLIGENLDVPNRPPGPLRSMQHPPAFNDPDRMRSGLFYNGVLDARGVHINSGVANKAAFLIADGGAFNGQSIRGLGIDRTARIFHQAQTTLLGPGSDYLDLYHALQQACSNLVGTVAGADLIVPDDCQQVTKAVTATEMHLAPVTAGARLTAPVCDAGMLAGEVLFRDDMESGLGQWVTSASHPSAVWTSFAGSSQSGTRSMHGPDIEVGTAADRSMTSEVRTAGAVTVPGGTTFLRFDHSFNLEGNQSGTVFYDGGVVEYSTSGAAGPWIDAEPLGMVNGYNGVLRTDDSTNPLRGRRAFSDTSPGYQTTRIDLSSLAGKSVMIRFRIATDQFAGADGWFVDDVSVHRCGVPSVPGPPQFPTASVANGQATVRWAAPAFVGFPALTNYVITPYANGAAQPPTTVAGDANAATIGGLVEGVSYTFTVAATNATGTGPAASTGNFFVAVGPARVLDTRPGESPTALRNVAEVRIGGEVGLQVRMVDLPGMTPPTGVAAVSLNVTATGAGLPGFVTVHPCSQRPQASSVNFAAGDTVANAVVTAVSAAGDVCLFANTPVDVVVDINGWFAPSPGFMPVTPARVLDTRPGESPGALRDVGERRIGGQDVLEVQVSDLPGATPGAGVSAVSLNVTATGSSLPGYVTVYPCGSRPTASNVNFGAGDTVANATITPVSPAGAICLFANTLVDVVVDINGWFAVDPGFAPAGPARVLDTRPGESPGAIRSVAKAPIGGTTVLEVKVSDLPGITPASGVKAVSLNVTATGSTLPGFVTAYPCGALSQVSNVNFAAGDTVANAVVTPVSPSGTICLFANTGVDVVVDINGWFG